MSATISVQGSTALEERFDSPVFEFGEQITRTNTYTGPWSTVASNIKLRGTVVTGWVIEKSTAQKTTGDNGILTDIWKPYGTGDLPLDEEECSAVELNPALAKHPFFEDLTKEDLANAEAYLSASTDTARNDADAAISTLGSSYIDKRQRGNENYYLAGLKYVVSTSYWTLPTLTIGGFIDTPDGPHDSSLPASFDWLREADTFKWDNGSFRVTRTWRGAPTGHWDTDLY